MLGFFKPKWQHRNPKVRIEAINNHGLDPEIILKIAQQDKDIDVRIAAFQFINELNVLYAISLQEPSDAGREAVLLKIVSVFEKAESPTETVNHFMTTIVRRDFPVADLLMLCEEPKIKQSLFPVMSVNKDFSKLIEKNYEFTVDELSAINDLSMLTFISKHANIKDKKVLGYLKEQIQKIEGDARKECLKAELLKKYEALAKEEQIAALNVFSELENSWNANQLGDDNHLHRKKYLERYQAHNARRQENIALLQKIEVNMLSEDTDIQSNIDGLKSLVDECTFSAKEKTRVQDLMKQLMSHADAKAKNDQLAMQTTTTLKDIKNALNKPHRLPLEELKQMQHMLLQLTMNVEERAALLTIVKEKIGQYAEVKYFDKAKFEERLSELEILIGKGELQAAQILDAALQTILKETADAKTFAHYNRALKTINQVLKNQLDTVRWGVLKSLEALCDEAEKLANEKSIELISITLSHLRDSWNDARKSLNHIPKQLHQRFENACHTAHQKVVAVKNSDNNARALYLEEAKGLLEQLSQFVAEINWEDPDWAALVEARQRFLKEWNRYLNQYSTDGVLSYGAPLFLAKDKHRLEKSMRQILKPLDKAIQMERAKEKKRREDEMAQLKALLNENQTKEAVALAKQLNRTFTPTVRSMRQVENLLWKEFRLLNDRVFAERSEMLSAEEGIQFSNAEEKRALLRDLQLLLTHLDEESDLETVVQQLHNIEDCWTKIGVVPKRDYVKLGNEFKKITDNIKEKISYLGEYEERAVRDNLLNIACDIGRLEAMALSGQSVIIDPEIAVVADRGLRKRIKCLEQIQTGQLVAMEYLHEKAEIALNVASELVVLREILMDRPSIEEDQEQRLALQVRVLEDSMNNGLGMIDKNVRLKNLDQKWLEDVVGIVPDYLYQRFR